MYDHQYVREILKETDCAYLRRNTYRAYSIVVRKNTAHLATTIIEYCLQPVPHMLIQVRYIVFILAAWSLGTLVFLGFVDSQRPVLVFLLLVFCRLP